MTKAPQLRPCLTLLVGACVLAVVLAERDLGAVVEAVALVGWGIALLVATHALPLLADTVGWRTLFAPSHRPSLGHSVLWRWIGVSINALLPAAQVGGDVVRARLAALAGFPVPTATASVIWDVLLGILTQVGFTLIGLSALLAVGRELPPRVTLSLFAGTGLLVLALALCLVLLRSSALARLARGRGRAAAWAADGALALDEQIRATMARRKQMALSSVWRLAGWVSGTVEVWLGFRLLGHPVGWAEALLVESLVHAARAAAFFIPAALGVQEVVLVLLSATLGLPPDSGLALSLLKRVRELAVGLPGLLTWQLIESRRASPPAPRG